MKQVITLARHNLKQFFNSWSGFILLILPILISIVVITVFKESNITMGSSTISWYSEDTTGVDEKLIQLLEKREIHVQRVGSEEVVNEQVHTGKVELGVVIQEQNILQALLERQEIIETVYKKENYKAQVISASLERSISKLYVLADISGDNIEKFNMLYKELEQDEIEVKVKWDEDASVEKMGFGMLVLLISLTALQCLIPVVKEKEAYIYDRIGMAPIKKSEYLLGHLLGSLLILSLQLVVQGLVMSVLKIDFGIPLLDFLGLTLIVGIVGIGIGHILLTLCANSKVYTSMMGIVITPLCMLSDCLFPIEMLPEWLGKVSYLSPIRWVMLAYRNIVEQKESQVILSNIAIALLITCVFILLNLVIESRRSSVD